jgi:seryl-tRNA synthetase
MVTTPYDKALERKGQPTKALAAAATPQVDAARSGQQSAAGNAVKATQEVAASKAALSTAGKTAATPGLMARVEKAQQNFATAQTELKKQNFNLQEALKKAQATPKPPTNAPNNGYKR